MVRCEEDGVLQSDISCGEFVVHNALPLARERLVENLELFYSGFLKPGKQGEYSQIITTNKEQDKGKRESSATENSLFTIPSVFPVSALSRTWSSIDMDAKQGENSEVKTTHREQDKVRRTKRCRLPKIYCLQYPPSFLRAPCQELEALPR